MFGEATRLHIFMEGPSTRFIIPVYQRNYDWKIENCKQLYDDLVKVIRNKKYSHFFGSIVYTNNQEGAKAEYLIIDGQQRLTTVSLLLLALYNLYKEGKIDIESESLNDISKDYLVDKNKQDESRIKLKAVKNDREAYCKLFENTDSHIKNSNLTTNYNYFYERIQKAEIPADRLLEAIRCLEIIEIKLGPEDNPQLVFESLNSTGLDLSEGDKIRNFILMGLPSKQQEAFYEKYWNPIEELTDYQVGLFIRDYLSVKQQATPPMNKIYFAFRNYTEVNEFESETLLADLLKYAKLYHILLKGTIEDKRLRACIERLNRLETTVTRPFFLEVLRLNKEGTLPLEDVVQIFLYTESYLFRRTICDLPTNVLNKLFLILHKEIIRYDGTENQYLEKMKYALLTKKERARFPNDRDFRNAFASKQVFLMNSKNKKYILERLENFGTKEDKNIYGHIEDGSFSIEHIMPQTLTPAWVKSLGDNYEQIHETWLHRIANLTLTAYNSKYSNHPFLEKRDMEDGFADSGLRMNQWISKQTQWGEDELQKRSNQLQDRALKIWPLPLTDYAPEEKELDNISLDDETDLTGKKLVRYIYKGIEQPAENWIDMFETVLRTFHSDDKSVLYDVVYSPQKYPEISVYVTDGTDPKFSYIEIDKGVYVKKATSTMAKLTILRRLFPLYKQDPNDLLFYLLDEEDNGGAVLTDKYETRRKFWKMALPVIKKANTQSGAFDNWNPSKDRWIHGVIGIAGFYLCCVVNNDSARVELTLEKYHSEENKKAFDLIHAHRSEIEQKLGVKLYWDRGKNKKSSKIYHKINAQGIISESNWVSTANFLAEWSRKFYDVIAVPYLKPADTDSVKPDQTALFGNDNPVQGHSGNDTPMHKGAASSEKNIIHLFNMRICSEDKTRIQEEAEKEGMTFQDYVIKAVKLRLNGKPPIKTIPRKQYSELDAVISCRLTSRLKRKIIIVAKSIGITASAFVLGALFGDYQI